MSAPDPGFQYFNTIHNEDYYTLNPGDKFLNQLINWLYREAGIWTRMKLLYWRRAKNDLCDCNLSLGLFYSLFLSELLARL